MRYMFCYKCLNPFIREDHITAKVKDIFGEIVESDKEPQIAETYCNNCHSTVIAEVRTLGSEEKIVKELYEKFDGQAEGHWEIPLFLLLLCAHEKATLWLNVEDIKVQVHPNCLTEYILDIIQRLLSENPSYANTIREIILKSAEIAGRNIIHKVFLAQVEKLCTSSATEKES
jgi:hypothetical protein